MISDHIKNINHSFNIDVATVLNYTSHRPFSESCFIQLHQNSINKRNDNTSPSSENYQVHF